MSCVHHEIQCVSALHPLKRKIPYGWDLNIYRGCSHACVYCYAQATHHEGVFSQDIQVKTNVAEVLEKELSSPSWKREIINIGGVTDSYQSAEATYRLMPDILRLLIKYRTPAIISTKSDLVLRDFNLIDELSRITYINIAATIVTVDDQVQKTLESGAVPAARRFAMLKEFRKTNASVGLHAMPIIPFLTDSAENLEALCAGAADAGVHYFLPGVLYLRGKTRPEFFKAIKTHYPHLLEPLMKLYGTGGAGLAYKNGMYGTLNAFRKKYALSGSYSAPMKEKLPRDTEGSSQLRLF